MGRTTVFQKPTSFSGGFNLLAALSLINQAEVGGISMPLLSRTGILETFSTIRLITNVTETGLHRNCWSESPRTTRLGRPGQVSDQGGPENRAGLQYSRSAFGREAGRLFPVRTFVVEESICRRMLRQRGVQ